jgi:hypothetical protein
MSYYALNKSRIKSNLPWQERLERAQLGPAGRLTSHLDLLIVRKYLYLEGRSLCTII